MDESTLGTLLVFAAAAGFGTIGIFGEIAASIDLALGTLLPIRFAVALGIVLGVALLREWSFPETTRDVSVTLLLGVVYTLMTLCYFVSLRYLTAGLATIVLYIYPTIVVVLSAVILREAVTARKVIALGLATAGVVLVVWTDTAGSDPVGVALALGAAVCYAVYTAGSRYVTPSATPRGVMIGVLVGTTISMTAYGVLSGNLGVPAGAREWGVVFGLAVASTVVPHLLFYEGVSRIEAGRAGVVSTVEPVVTVALGVVLLGEPFTIFVALGGALVLCGVVLVQRDRAGTEVSAS